MALIPHNFFPRSMFDTDEWMRPMSHGPNTLDLFDPFDELDHVVGRNMQWLNKPEFMQPMLPRVPQKYRITLDCVGYKPESIKTDVKGHTLYVIGREEVKHSDCDDFSLKEFKKTYTLPERAEPEKLVSFLTKDGQMVIEVPLKEVDLHPNMDLFPRIVDTDAGKQVQMKFAVPENIHPEHIHINIKDRCLIVKAEEKIKKPDGVSKFHYYKRTTLPENTDFDALKCNYENHEISVTAPVNLNYKPVKKIDIQNKPAIMDKKHTATTPAVAEKMQM